MADNNSNKNNTTKTFKALSALCLTRPIDILYFIANISYYYSVDQTLTVKYLEELKIKDANTGLFCLQRIEEKILKEIGDEYKDKEIEEVYRKSKEEYELKRLEESKKKEETKEINKEESKKEEKENLKEKEFNEEEKHTEETSEEKNTHFNYLDYFSALIKPFLFVNDKVCVDFIAYLYKKKDLDYFDLLFEAHADKKDLMIELHLLKGRLLKSKIKNKNTSKLDVTEIQEALRRSNSKKEGEDILQEKNISEEKEDKKQLKESLLEKENIVQDESPTANVLEIESESEIKDITNNSVNISPSLLTYHINSAKLLLLNITKKDQKFFIDNAALFLTIQYDRDIFRELLLLSKLPYFFTCLYSTSTNIILPFYFYKYVYMNTCIYYDIPYNGYTLKYYLEYYKTLSTNVFPNDIGYVLVGKNMMMYYNETKAVIKEDKVFSKKLKMIFREMVVFLLQLKFVREDEIHMKILENVEEYVEIFKEEIGDNLEETKDEDKEDNCNNPTLNHQMHINELTEKLKDEKFITRAIEDYENILKEKEDDKENIKIITDTINNYSINHKTFLFNYLFDDLLINYITNIKYKHIFIEKIVKNKMIAQLSERVREEIVKSIKEKKDEPVEDAKYKVNKDKGNWRYRKYVEEHKKEIEEMVE